MVFTKLDEKDNIEQGEKEIMRGTITDRTSRKRVATDLAAEPGDSIEQVNYFHYLILGTDEFMVDKQTYNSHGIGDTVDIHYLPSTGFFIKVDSVPN